MIVILLRNVGVDLESINGRQQWVYAFIKKPPTVTHSFQQRTHDRASVALHERCLLLMVFNVLTIDSVDYLNNYYFGIVGNLSQWISRPTFLRHNRFHCVIVKRCIATLSLAAACPLYKVAFHKALLFLLLTMSVGAIRSESITHNLFADENLIYASSKYDVHSAYL